MTKNLKKTIGIGVAALFAFIFVMDGFYIREEGRWYAVQNSMPLVSGITITDDIGMDGKAPFFNTIKTYNDFTTLVYGDASVSASSVKECISVKFADTYRACIPVTFRFETKSNGKIHSDFRSHERLVDLLLTKTARSVTVATAEQFTGEEFFQGGLNNFRNALEDQLTNGLQRTERKKVEIEEIVEGAAGEEGGTRVEKKLVFKTVPLRDANGDFIRIANPLDPYNISIVQVTMGEAKPEDQLETMLTTKKRLVGERIAAVQEQATAKAQAVTAKLKKDIEIERAKQDAIMIKEREEINAERVAEVARINEQREKDIAVIQKEKQLAIAIADKDIQIAAAEAAKAQGEAIKFKGFAEAAVLDAHYKALGKNSEIVLAEYNKEVQLAIATALPDTDITMPTYLTVGGEGNQSTNSVDQTIDLVKLNAAKNLLAAKKK